MKIQDTDAAVLLKRDDVYRHTPGADLSPDEIFEVLSNDRRRCTLHYLKQCDERRVPLREVVDYVTAWENDVPIDQIDSNARKCVYTALRQSHLPKLDKTGVVDYDQRRGEVELTDAAREVQVYMEYVPGNDIPWSEYYLGLSAVLATLAVVSWVGVYPFDGVSWIAMTFLVVTTTLLSAVVHTYHTHQNELGGDEFLEVEGES